MCSPLQSIFHNTFKMSLFWSLSTPKVPSSSWEASSLSTGQDIPRIRRYIALTISWNSRIHFTQSHSIV
jgi:hypothetical protein